MIYYLLISQMSNIKGWTEVYIKDKIFPVASYNKLINQHLPYDFEYDYIYQSAGLEKHILKRHPECVEYLQYLPFIIAHPDYIGINPNESGYSFELVKKFDTNE